MYEPIRWNARFGWRRFVENERLAWFHYWREVGRRMAIKDILSTSEDERYNAEYERENFRFTETSARAARASRDMFVAWFPGVPQGVGGYAISALMDERLRDAIGFPRPPRGLVAAVTGSLRARAAAVRLLPPRRRPKLRTAIRHRTYRQGYVLEALGPMPPDAV